MKLNKFIAFAVAALTFSACSNDDASWNTATGVTVNLSQTEMAISEDAEAGRYYYIPVVVDGEANGNIEVTVEFSPVAASPAVEDKDYVVTQKTIIIPAGEASGNIEFYPTGDDIENDDRQFVVTLVKAVGAAVGPQTACTVTLKDNERLIPEAYRNIQGMWTMTCVNSDEPDQYTVNIKGYNEGETGYLSDLIISGWNGVSYTEDLVAKFSFDASTNQAIITIPLGQWVAYDLNFGAQLGVCDVMLASVNYSSSGASLAATGSVSATSNEEMTEISFSDSTELVGAIFDSSGSFTGYTWFWKESMKMTR